MNPLVPVQTWLPRDVALEVKSHCRKSAISTSEFIRSLVLEAHACGLERNRIEQRLGRIDSDINFIAVALDVLLSGHDNKELREHAHEAFAEREHRRRKSLGSHGGEDQ